MRYVKEKDDNTGEVYKGWTALLIPKGQEFCSDNLHNYLGVYLDELLTLHTCIAIADQEVHVNVVDKDGATIDAPTYFDNVFGHRMKAATDLHSWDDFGDDGKLKPVKLSKKGDDGKLKPSKKE